MANESALRGRVCGWLREAGFFVQPIETGSIVEGVPDLWFALNKEVHGWLELKKIKEMPKKDTTAVFKSLNHPLSNSQANWIGVARSHGQRANIFIQSDREYFLVPGSLADMFNELTESDLRKYKSSKLHLLAVLTNNVQA